MSRPRSLDEAKHRQANEVDEDDDVMGDEQPMICRRPDPLTPMPRVRSLSEALIFPFSRQSHALLSNIGLDLGLEFVVGRKFVIFVGMAFISDKTSVRRPSSDAERRRSQIMLDFVLQF